MRSDSRARTQALQQSVQLPWPLESAQRPLSLALLIHSCCDLFPYPNAPRVVRIWNTFAPRGMTEIPFSEPEFNEYRQSQSFAHVAGFSVGTLTLTGNGDPLHVAASWGTPDFFSVMGTAPLLGRVFTTDEQQQGHAQVAVLSHRLWQSRFASTGRSSESLFS